VKRGYKADYHVESGESSTESESSEKRLRVCFDFSQEVARVDLGEVIARIRDGRDIGDELHAYLTSCVGEALKYRATPSGKPVEYCDVNREVIVYPGKGRNLGFVVKVNTKKNIPLESLLNCDELNRFILTGKV